MRPIQAIGLGMAVVLSACSTPAPPATPYPTPAPRAAASEAQGIARGFLAAWRAGDWFRMYQLISPADQQRISEDEFEEFHRSFNELAAVGELQYAIGSTFRTSLPPEPRPADIPPPPTPRPTGGPSDAPGATRGASPSVQPTPVPPDTPLAGPVPALRVLVALHFDTYRFDRVDLQREFVLTESADGWRVRWSRALLFPELGDDGRLTLARRNPKRGRIVARDGTVYARSRGDGVRVYPQEWLAGHTIGYVTPVTDTERRAQPEKNYRRGEVVGRMGLEYGADDLLRGQPGFRLVARRPSHAPVTMMERPMVPGADLTITLRRPIQQTADAAIAGYAGAGTAVIDPTSGDVWALASAPPFNPNAMTLGTTLGGQPLGPPDANQRLNKATLGAYPTGSSFKPFTLAAALKLGVASPATRMTCNGTWTFSGFTFHNYEDHSLGGLVDLLQAMAFSCNTTYMPLSIRVYERDSSALTDLVHEFGFGQFTGIRHLVEESGVLPDAAYYEETPRWHGSLSPYGPFDQIQLAIGQGELLATPLQMANAYAAFANGGRLWVPRLVLEARLPDGTVVERNRPTVKRRISLRQRDLDYVIEALKAVVNYPYGTAYPVFGGFGTQVAGKSGTAETGGPDPNAWFPAFAPAGNARISVATVLVRVPLATGGSDAAPLVRRVMSTYFATR